MGNSSSWTHLADKISYVMVNSDGETHAASFPNVEVSNSCSFSLAIHRMSGDKVRS